MLNYTIQRTKTVHGNDNQENDNKQLFGERDRKRRDNYENDDGDDIKSIRGSVLSGYNAFNKKGYKFGVVMDLPKLNGDKLPESDLKKLTNQENETASEKDDRIQALKNRRKSFHAQISASVDQESPLFEIIPKRDKTKQVPLKNYPLPAPEAQNPGKENLMQKILQNLNTQIEDKPTMQDQQKGSGQMVSKVSFALDQKDLFKRMGANLKNLFSKKSAVIKDKQFSSMIYQDTEQFGKLQKKFLQDWGGRKPLIMNQMKNQMNTFLVHSKEIQSYLRDELDNSDISSMGSISSADERDGEILFSGEMHFFQFKKMVQKFVDQRSTSRKQLEKKAMLSRNIFCSKCCRKKEKKDQILNKISLGILDKIDENEQSPIKKKEFSTKVGIESAQSPSIKPENKEPGLLRKLTGSLNQGGDRSGKDLWLKIKKLSLEKQKMSKLNKEPGIAGDILQIARLEKQKREAKEQEERKQMEEFQELEDGRDGQNDSIRRRNLLDDDEVVLEFGQSGYMKQQMSKLEKYYGEKLIEPTNIKLKYFHLLVSVTLFFDFILTSFIIGNYKFYFDQQERQNGTFKNHRTYYELISAIQIIDIILNFFKIELSKNNAEQPFKIFMDYFKGNFLIDLIAVIPYTIFYPPLLSLRYLKLIKFNTYLTYFENWFFDGFQSIIEQELLNIIISMLRLLFQVIMVSHVIACFWILIGQYFYYEHQDGWIQAAEENNFQMTDYFSVYITALYWTIATFTSVGYGDIIGVNTMENLYQMLVELVGMCFFGYMMGTFQALIQSISENDELTELQETIDHNLMKLDKTIKDKVVIPSIYFGVKDFYDQKYKLDAMDIQNSEFFQQLKPRHQRELLDIVFEDFYKQFATIFKDFDELDPSFKREIFRSCKFSYWQNNFEDDEDLVSQEWPNRDPAPQVIRANHFSDKLYFILSGQIHIMSKDGLLQYGTLLEGSYFGDISILLDEPNQFSYYYDPFMTRPVILLSIEKTIFKNICSQHKIPFEILKQKAEERQKLFVNYKMVRLLGCMKTVKKNPYLVIKKSTLANLTFMSRVKLMQHSKERVKIIRYLMKQYDLKRLHEKVSMLEKAQKSKKKKLSAKSRQLTENLKNSIQLILNKSNNVTKRERRNGLLGVSENQTKRPSDNKISKSNSSKSSFKSERIDTSPASQMGQNQPKLAILNFDSVKIDNNIQMQSKESSSLQLINKMVKIESKSPSVFQMDNTPLSDPKPSKTYSSEQLSQQLSEASSINLEHPEMSQAEITIPKITEQPQIRPAQINELQNVTSIEIQQIPKIPFQYEVQNQIEPNNDIKSEAEIQSSVAQFEIKNFYEKISLDQEQVIQEESIDEMIEQPEPSSIQTVGVKKKLKMSSRDHKQMTVTINSQRDQISKLKKANARAFQTIKSQREQNKSMNRIPKVIKQGFLTSIEYPNGRLYDNNTRTFRGMYRDQYSQSIELSQRESRATMQNQSINVEQIQPQIRLSRRRPQSGNPRASHHPTQQANENTQGQGIQHRANNNESIMSNFQDQYQRARQTISYFEGGDNSASGASLFQNYQFGKTIIKTESNQQIKQIKQEDYDGQSVKSQQVKIPNFKDILIMPASDEESPKKVKNSDIRKQNTKRDQYRSKLLRSNSEVLDDKEIRHKVLDCKKSPSQSSMSQHSLNQMNLNDTDQIQRAIDQNTTNLIKSLKQYFVKKALEAVKDFQDEEEREQQLRQKRRQIIKNDSHCSHKSHNTSEDEESHSDHSHNSDSSDDHNNQSHSSASLQRKKNKKAKDELEKLKKSLKYLDLLIDEYVDMPLIKHQMKKWQAQMAQQQRSQYPPKSFESTKKARDKKISEILSQNPSSKIQLKFVDEQIANDNDKKINQLKDHFTYDATKDKAHLDIYLNSIDRQLDTNHGFKKIYDKNFVALNKTIADFDQSLGFKMALLKDKMKSVKNFSGYSSATQRSVSSSNSRVRYISGKMSTFYKQDIRSRSQFNDSSDNSKSD